jgi:hypothetical protein
MPELGRWAGLEGGLPGGWAAERSDGTVSVSASPCGALNSAVECHLHTVEVAGSNPAAPTISKPQISKSLRSLIEPWVTGILGALKGHLSILDLFRQMRKEAS